MVELTFTGQFARVITSAFPRAISQPSRASTLPAIMMRLSSYENGKSFARYHAEKLSLFPLPTE